MSAIQIIAPHFTGYVEVGDSGKVVRAAPIVNYMMSWSVERVTQYCDKKGWKWTPI
jgi:hypothetical protein